MLTTDNVPLSIVMDMRPEISLNAPQTLAAAPIRHV